MHGFCWLLWLPTLPRQWHEHQTTAANRLCAVEERQKRLKLYCHKPVTQFMKQKKLILLSIAIPVLFALLVAFRKFLEYYFRFSKEYKYIYSYGSTFSLFVQLFLILSSFILGIYIIVNRKQYTFWTTLISFVFGLSLFLYFTTALLISLIKTGI